MDGLKVGILTDMCGPFFGGGYQGTLWEVARRLARRHEVRVYTSLPVPHDERERVRFHRVLPMGLYPDTTGTRGALQPALLPALLARDVIAPWTPDALIVEAMPLSHLPTIGRWLRRRPGLRLLNVDEAWVGYPPFSGAIAPTSLRVARWLLSQGLSWTDTALAVSEATATALTGAYAARDVLAFPSGIDVSRLRAELPPEGTERAWDVISVGRLVPMKRHIDLVHALGLLKRRYGWSGRAVIVGDGPCRGQLEAGIRVEALSGQVELVGRVNEARKMDLLGRSRLFVLSSEREGFSLATLEAMLAGCLPIVAEPPFPEVFGAGGLVSEGRTGHRYPLGAVERLTEVLHRLLSDPGALRPLVENARALVPSYDWDALISKFEPELLRRVRRRAASRS